jgi:hypothetical protein
MFARSKITWFVAIVLNVALVPLATQAFAANNHHKAGLAYATSFKNGKLASAQIYPGDTLNTNMPRHWIDDPDSPGG